MKYATILAVDDRVKRWRAVGVIAHNTHGVAVIKFDRQDPVVQRNREFLLMERSYNEALEEGELTFYEKRPQYESCSPIGRISTSDKDFIAKCKEKLEQSGSQKLMLIGEIRTYPSENILEHIDRLLEEVTSANAGTQPAPAAGR